MACGLPADRMVRARAQPGAKSPPACRSGGASRTVAGVPLLCDGVVVLPSACRARVSRPRSRQPSNRPWARLYADCEHAVERRAASSLPGACRTSSGPALVLRASRNLVDDVEPTVETPGGH